MTAGDLKLQRKKKYLRDEIKLILQCMDFVLNKAEPSANVYRPFYDSLMYAEIYQFLGYAWSEIAKECQHWDGMDKQGFCKICGHRNVPPKLKKIYNRCVNKRNLYDKGSGRVTSIWE